MYKNLSWQIEQRIYGSISTCSSLAVFSGCLARLYTVKAIADACPKAKKCIRASPAHHCSTTQKTPWHFTRGQAVGGEMRSTCSEGARAVDVKCKFKRN